LQIVKFLSEKKMDFDGVPPPLTDSDNSDDGSGSEVEEGTSDYGSKTGNDDSERSDSEESTPPPEPEQPPPSKDSEELRSEGNELFREGRYADAIHKYEEAIKAGKGNVENKAKCYSNITHCYNKKKDYNKAVEVAFKAMDAKPDFWRVYLRCATAFVNLNESKMAVMVLLKGQAWCPNNSDLQEELAKIDSTVRGDAKKYLDKYYKNNAKDVNLKKLREKGFKKDEEKVEEKKPKELPGLIASSNESSSDSSSSSEDYASMEGGKPSENKTKSPKKKKSTRRHSRGSKASSKSGDDSSDDESNKITRKGNKKNKTAELIKENQKKEEEQLKLKQQIEEVKKEEERKEAEKKKAALELKKAEEEKKKREEEDRKKILAMNDPKETAWLKFNDILAEASTLFMGETPNFTRSKDKYGEALDIIAKNFPTLKFKSKKVSCCEEVVVIKFMFARACTETNNYTDIVSGHSKMEDIVKLHKDVRFPAVYLGFALLFKKLNRYDYALQYTEKGVDFFEKNLPCITYNYPGVPSQPLEETRPDYLKKKFSLLQIEFKCPPKPEAICKYKSCLVVNKNNHIIPSENIYLSDPDYKGYFKVWCRSNCALDYHENCWTALKTDYIDIIAKANRTPTEKDFFGMTCFTPDCDGIIIKIQIYDAYGDFKTLEDKKLLEKIENEEKIRKEEEKKKKEKEIKEQQMRKLEEKKKNKKRKERNKSSSEKDSDSVKEEKVDSIPKVVVPPNLPSVENYSKTSTPPPDIPLDKITILKKHKEPEVEDDTTDKKRTKKSKERTTLHLEEFKNSNSEGPAYGMADNTEYQARIDRLAATKKQFEEMSRPNATNNLHNHVQPNSFATMKLSLEEKMDNYLNPNASVFSPNNSEKLSPEVIEESVKTFVLQSLTTHGPMKETDGKFTRQFGADAMKRILDSRGLINFLKGDERFSSYGEYICLRADAEKAKMLSEQDTKARETATKTPTNLGEMARKIREQLERDEKPMPELNKPVGGFGLAQAASEASILDSIKKNATVGKTPIVESSVRRSCDLGVQTDVSSLDLDELDDPIMLKQTNTALIAELQESKDKLYKIQNERKVESKEMTDKARVLNEEKSKLKTENGSLKETIQKMTKTYKESSKKEEELKQTKENFDLECQKSSMIRDELNSTKLRLENEQRLSFQLQSQLQGSREQEGFLKTLKLKCLKTEFEAARSFLMGKKVENEKLISYLAIMNNSEVHQGSNTIKSSIEKLNEFSARLYRAIDDLQEKYEEKVRQIERNHGIEVSDLNFDTASFDSPQLTSVDVDTLRLLASVNLNSRPQVAPFANYPNTTRPPPSRPPGLLGPPPGLPPMAETSNNLTDNLASLRAAAIARPRAASSPRPDPGLPVTTRPTHTAAPTRPVASVPATARPGVSASSKGPVEGGKNKSYMKLLAQLQFKHSELSTDDAARYIHMLRNENNGKLSGMSIQAINERVGLFMRADQQRKRTESDTDNNCSICLEDMTDRDSRRLNPCLHKFHNMCINNWLATPGGAGNTCPMCRHYIVQENEFPDLGHIGHRRH